MAHGGRIAAATRIAVAELDLAVETARTATMAIHAAVEVAWPLHRQAARSLRAAEALCRLAVALLAAAPTTVLSPSRKRWPL